LSYDPLAKKEVNGKVPLDFVNPYYVLSHTITGIKKQPIRNFQCFPFLVWSFHVTSIFQLKIKFRVINRLYQVIIKQPWAAAKSATKMAY